MHVEHVKFIRLYKISSYQKILRSIKNYNNTIIYKLLRSRVQIHVHLNIGIKIRKIIE